MIYVWVDAGDGPVLVEHTELEFARLWRGVDREAEKALRTRVDPNPDDASTSLSDKEL